MEKPWNRVCVQNGDEFPRQSGDDMRSEQEMLDLILSVAENDESIRVVMMNSLRVNPRQKGCFSGL